MKKPFCRVNFVRVAAGFVLGLAALPLIAQIEAPEDSAHAAPQQRRGGGPEHGVYQARVAAHWLTNATQFWYRNDLRGGAREFILVDAGRGARKPAFDHKAVAKLILIDLKKGK